MHQYIDIHNACMHLPSPFQSAEKLTSLSPPSPCQQLFSSTQYCCPSRMDNVSSAQEPHASSVPAHLQCKSHMPAQRQLIHSAIATRQLSASSALLPALTARNPELAFWHIPWTVCTVCTRGASPNSNRSNHSSNNHSPPVPSAKRLKCARARLIIDDSALASHQALASQVRASVT